MPDKPPKEQLTPPLQQISVTQDDVTKALKNLRTDKFPGIDGIHPRPLKEVADFLAKPITMMFQLNHYNQESWQETG